MAHMTRLASYGPFFVVADHLTIVVVFVVVVVVVRCGSRGPAVVIGNYCK
jgi:hypothetical protein